MIRHQGPSTGLLGVKADVSNSHQNLPSPSISCSCKGNRHVVVVHFDGSEDAFETIGLEILVIHLHVYEEDSKDGEVGKLQTSDSVCDSVGFVGYNAQRHLDGACKIATDHIAQFAW
jgi:hypothetical protein